MVPFMPMTAIILIVGFNDRNKSNFKPHCPLCDILLRSPRYVFHSYACHRRSHFNKLWHKWNITIINKSNSLPPIITLINKVNSLPPLLVFFHLLSRALYIRPTLCWTNNDTLCYLIPHGYLFISYQCLAIATCQRVCGPN